MKREVHILLSILSVAVLIVSSGSVSKASEAFYNSIKAMTVKKQVEAEKNKSATEAVETKTTEESAITGKIPIMTMKTGKENPDKLGIITLSAQNRVTNCQYQYSQAVTFKTKGTLSLAGYYEDGKVRSGNNYMHIGLFYDKNLTNYVGPDVILEKKDDVGSQVYHIKTAGTYYIGVYAFAHIYTDRKEDTWTLGAMGLFYNGADRTIYNGQQIAVGLPEKEQTNYYKFVAQKTGYVTAMTDKKSLDTLKVALCNSKKKAFSGYTPGGYLPTYGVKKGQTYYFKVVSPYRSSGRYLFRIDNYSVSEKSGTSKSNAVALKKGKMKEGVILAGSSQADWYKFTLNSKQSVSLTWKAKTNDKMKITIYNGGNSIGTRTLTYKESSYLLKSQGKWSKGTYYIKVYRGNSKSSGWYSLKLK